MSSHSYMFGAEFFSHHGSFGLILALRTIVAPRVVVVVVGLDVDVRVLAGGAARGIAVVVVVVVIAYIVVVRPSVRPFVACTNVK